jgi:hypothetical protein
MRVLWVTINDMTAEPWHRSLESLSEHQIVKVWFGNPIFGPADDRILRAVKEFNPDAVIYTGYPATNPLAPKPETFYNIGARKIFLAGDLSDPPWQEFLLPFRQAGAFDRYVNIDGNPAWETGPCDITLLSPIAPQYYNDPSPLIHRPYRIGFAGGYSSPSRAVFIDTLRRSGGLTLHTRDERYGSYGDYAMFLRKCKMVFNVPFSGSDGSKQVKGRVLETAMAGALLLEHEESPTSLYFTPGEDYITYANNPTSALVKALAVYPKAQEIADSLRKKVVENHSPKKFWERVFDGLE